MEDMQQCKSSCLVMVVGRKALTIFQDLEREKTKQGLNAESETFMESQVVGVF